MYDWLYHDNPYRAYPLFAFGVFVVFFAGVFVWAYWPRRAATLDEHARLALAEDGLDGGDDHGR